MPHMSLSEEPKIISSKRFIVKTELWESATVSIVLTIYYSFSPIILGSPYI